MTEVIECLPRKWEFKHWWTKRERERERERVADRQTDWQEFFTIVVCNRTSKIV
jgi:hypothetical protein